MSPEEFLSRVLHPLLVLPVSAAIFLSFSGLDLWQAIYWTGFWIVLSLLPTSLVIWFTGERKLNIVSREKRKTSFLTGLVSMTGALLLIDFLSTPSLVVKVGTVGVLAVTVFGLANFFNKVSIHTGSITCIAAVYTVLSPEASVALMLSSALVGWSRVELDCHTPVQVVQGGVLGFLCGLAFLAL